MSEIKLSEIKHTPGPWITAKVAKVTPGKTQVVWAVISPKRGATNPVSGLSPLFPSSEQEANAYLIAAAPSMLEALEICLHQARVDRPPTHRLDLIAEYAAQAIAKAKGEAK